MKDFLECLMLTIISIVCLIIIAASFFAAGYQIYLVTKSNPKCLLSNDPILCITVDKGHNQ